MEVSPVGVEGMMAALAGFFLVVLVLLLIVYLYSAFALMAIAKKKNVDPDSKRFCQLGAKRRLTQIY